MAILTKAVIRESLFYFVKRCRALTIFRINAVMNSDVFYELKYFHTYCGSVQGGTSQDFVKNCCLLWYDFYLWYVCELVFAFFLLMI